MLIPTLPEKVHIIVSRPDKLQGIKCTQNNLISWNPMDVKNRWCPSCELFVKIEPDIVKIKEDNKVKQPGTLNSRQG